MRERGWASAAPSAPPDPITTLAPPDASAARVQPDPGTAPVQAGRSSSADQGSNVATTAAPPGHRAARPLSPEPPPLGPVRRSAVLVTVARDSLARTIAQADTAWARAQRTWARAQRTWTRTQLAWAWLRLAYTQLKPERHERLAGWTARCAQQLGDVVFAGEDAEAAWHAWHVEPRYAGLGRLYRDQRFDALVACPRCHRVSTVAGRPVCKQCSAADRLVRA